MNLIHALLQNQCSKKTILQNEKISKGWNCTSTKTCKKLIACRRLIRRFTKKLRTKSEVRNGWKLWNAILVVLDHKCLSNIILYIGQMKPKLILHIAGPISASLRPATQLLSKKCHNGGEPLATLCPIWPARELNITPPTLETNTLPLDQLAGYLILCLIVTMNWFRGRKFLTSKKCSWSTVIVILEYEFHFHTRTSATIMNRSFTRL